MTLGELVFLVWNDFVGLSRTRGVPLAELERRRAKGLGWALAGQSLTPFEEIAANPWGPMDEVRQTPDLEARLRVVLKPDMPALHIVLCDALKDDGSPWEWLHARVPQEGARRPRGRDRAGAADRL